MSKEKSGKSSLGRSPILSSASSSANISLPQGFSINSSTRVPPVFNPKDLTLGTPSKRTFAPNIPVRREKNAVSAAPVVEKNNVAVKTEKNRPQSSKRGRGRGRKPPVFIQTEGAIFGETMPDIEKKVRSRRKESSCSCSDSNLKKKDTPNIKQELADSVKMLNVGNIDDDIISGLLKDDFVADFNEEKEKETPPVVLPMSLDVKTETNETKSSLVKDLKSNFKNFEQLEIDDERKLLKMKSKISFKEGMKESTEVEPVESLENFQKLKSTGKPEFLFIQFPHLVYGQASKEKAVAEMNSSTEDSKNTSSSLPNSLSGLSGGFIGKLQFTKSGKTRLIIGSQIYDVVSGSPSTFLQDVVIIKEGREKDNEATEVAVVGHVQQKILCTPNFNKIL